MVEELIRGRNIFNQPAGHLEEGERFIDAVKRETLEETGWIVKPRHLLGLYVYLTDDRSLTFHRACFIADAIEEIPNATLDDAIIRACWMTRDEIAARSDQLRSDLVLRCIDDYLAGIRYPLTVLQDQAVDSFNEK